MANAFIKLHISIFLAGFTGILGGLILLPEGPLVWYRMVLTSVLFFIYLLSTGKLPRVPLREALTICGIGVLVSLHWVFFYGSVKYANVSIAVVCFASTGFFTAIFEPVYYRRMPYWRDLFFSLLVILGIALIFHFDSQYRTGIVLGIICAMFAALFTTAIKQVGKRHDASTMLLYQMVGGAVFLTMMAPAYLYFFPETPCLPGLRDLFYLLILASACTIGMFLLQIQALRTISAFTVNLSFNLEPVYSIIMAMLFLGEANRLNFSFFVGLGLICISVLCQSIYAMRQRDAMN